MASIYDRSLLDEDDLKRIEELGYAWQKAEDEKEKEQLHSAAEAIRNSYGYSGGSDGSEFNVNNLGVVGVAKAQGDLTDALYNSQKDAESRYEVQIEEVTQSAADRLRQAYIKNMQDSLGLAQKLKGAGITGGATETAVAYMNNSYNNTRSDIMSDSADDIQKLRTEAAEAKAKSELEIAKAKSENASERAKLLADAEKEEYERMINERDFEYEKSKDERDFEYEKSKDERDFNFAKETDARDFEYKKEQDEKSEQLAQQKLAQSAANKSSSSGSSGSNKNSEMSVSNVIALIKAGAYSESFASILGISDEEVRNMAKSFSEAEKRTAAWALLEDGIYDESFPELLGYDADVLKNYANTRLPRG